METGQGAEMGRCVVELYYQLSRACKGEGGRCRESKGPPQLECIHPLSLDERHIPFMSS